MDRATKERQVEELHGKMKEASIAIIAEFTGLDVATTTEIRRKCRENQVEYKVVKNTLVKKALAAEPWAEGLDSVLKGMTGVAWSFEEPSAAARVVNDFVKDNEKLKVKAGLLEGSVLSAKAVTDQLAKLPSKDEARATLLATLMAPAQTFVRLLNAPAQQLVLVLNAKQNKDGG